MVDDLHRRFHDFRRAYDEGALAIAEFDEFAPTRRTLRQFLAACADLGQLVRDILLPNPRRPMIRLTMAQALIRFLCAQSTERDGRRQPFFAGVFGIFGHGNVAGVGQALDQMRDRMRYYQCRNEQAMVHTAAAFAKMSNRLRTLRLHLVYRARRHEYGHRRGWRDDQPTAGVAPAGRYLRQP